MFMVTMFKRWALFDNKDYQLLAAKSRTMEAADKGLHPPFSLKKISYFTVFSSLVLLATATGIGLIAGKYSRHMFPELFPCKLLVLVSLEGT